MMFFEDFTYNFTLLFSTLLLIFQIMIEYWKIYNISILILTFLIILNLTQSK